MEFSEVLKNRHATRFFKSQPIKISDVEEIIKDAQTAPSWLNAQERKVYVATDDKAKIIKMQFQARARSDMIGVSDFTAVHRTDWSETAQANMQKFSRDIEKFLGDKFADYVNSQDNLFNAPTFVYLTLPKNPSRWAILDLGAFAQTLLLSAASRGIGSIIAYAIIKYPDIIRKHLPIFEDEEISIGIALGYEDTTQIINQFRAGRVPLENILVEKHNFYENV